MDKEDAVHMHAGIHRKNEVVPVAATWMDLETITGQKYNAVECALVHCLWRTSKNWHYINEKLDIHFDQQSS